MPRLPHLATCIALAGAACATAPLPSGPGAMRLVVLGTGTPNADPLRSGPALAVVAHGHAYLFDAGPGIVRRAAAAAATHHLTALEPEGLDTVFLTHLHSDHTLGLPDLMLSPWTLERSRPLRVFGPPGTAAMTHALQEAYAEDVHVRLDGLEPANRTGWEAAPHEIATPGVVLEEDGLRVEAFPVQHGSWPTAYGFRIQDGARTIVLSGDTRPCPALIEAARGADVLVHEVYSARRLDTRPPEWRRYHESFHTSTRELAALAREARPRLLVLVHQLYWGASDAELVRELHAYGYDGRVVSARDLDVF